MGQTTAEGVIEFPKNHIRDVRDAVVRIAQEGDDPALHEDIRNISLVRNNAIADYTISGGSPSQVIIYFANGITTYQETIYV